MILIDSSVLVAYGVEEDVNHGSAVEIIKQIAGGKFGKAITSDYIFDETVTVTLIRSKSLSKAVLVGHYLKASTDVLKVDESIFDDAWDMFKNQKTSRLSFTDCTIFSLVKKYDVLNIATFDKEFKKLGDVKIVGAE